MNESFKISVDIEMLIRENASKNLFLTKKDDTNVLERGVGIIDTDSISALGTSVSLMFQEYLFQNQFYISLPDVDSLFHSEINKQHIEGEFIINRLNPITGEVLETTGKNETGTLKGAMASTIIPIRMDGSEGMQVLLVSPYRTIFRQMTFILILSLLLVIFVGYAMFYQLRSVIKEKHLRQLQTDFSNALIHDMNTPLQTIAQVNALLKDDRISHHPEKRNTYIHLAQQQILNLQAIIDRILTIARAENTRLEVNLTLLSAKEIILPLVEKFQVQAKKQVTFTTDFIPEDILFQADRTLLTNAISNVIDNAVKYSGPSVTIDIRCEQIDNDVYIYIKDNGYGISKKDQEKIFAKFERGKAVERKEAKGFGLGLSYVKRVMEAHLGTVNLFSREGKGTEFVLYLPFRKEK
ncbi:sensor histidine kinase [Limibacterium fermenti]|uniref:sensor histidine kinase n=1 Tax=Limibacterium fermenti TaxID=3229863 RepID=UPI003A7927FB